MDIVNKATELDTLEGFLEEVTLTSRSREKPEVNQATACAKASVWRLRSRQAHVAPGRKGSEVWEGGNIRDVGGHRLQRGPPRGAAGSRWVT